MNEYAVTLINESGPFFLINATKIEKTYDTYTKKPKNIIFKFNDTIICLVPYKDIHEIAQLINFEYYKLEI